MKPQLFYQNTVEWTLTDTEHLLTYVSENHEKKNGHWFICRQLTRFILLNTNPLLHIDKMIGEIAKYCVFSTFDLMTAVLIK